MKMSQMTIPRPFLKFQMVALAHQTAYFANLTKPLN